MSEFLRAMNPDETHYELLHNCKPTLLAKEFVNPKFHDINIHQYSDKSHESAEFWRIYTGKPQVLQIFANSFFANDGNSSSSSFLI